ncbi:hypothetical protein [Alteromonas sp. V450]|uniref:hypothetical protein n=1 Tax=Alteromonas sp. V450 TaxID=1912139 RepID=UPI0011604055|nr:hypothetical protein [Alteromonas sp. V450]
MLPTIRLCRLRQGLGKTRRANKKGILFQVGHHYSAEHGKDDIEHLSCGFEKAMLLFPQSVTLFS